MINLGQTCVAPDYVLCNSAVRDKLIAKINQTTQDFFGPMETALLNNRKVDDLI